MRLRNDECWIRGQDEKKAIVKALKLLGEIFKSTGDRVTKETELAYYRMQQEQKKQQF